METKYKNNVIKEESYIYCISAKVEEETYYLKDNPNYGVYLIDNIDEATTYSEPIAEYIVDGIKGNASYKNCTDICVVRVGATLKFEGVISVERN